MITAELSNVIIFTDLDGTLLDHATYRYDPALEALEFLKVNQIPLILASSKTAAEIRPLQVEMGFEQYPAIVENGAGVLWPGDEEIARNESYLEICEILNGLPTDLRACFKGFSDWSAEEVSARTGLSHSQALFSKQRQFSEPIEWHGDEEDWHDFVAALFENELLAQKGGRFFSISKGDTKAGQMSKIEIHFQRNNQHPFILALGDGENDIDMLESADIGVIIPNPTHAGIGQLEGEASGKIIRASLPGPEGWNDTIKMLIMAKGD